MKTGIDAKDYDSVVRESDLVPSELQARKVEDLSKDLQKTMRFALKQGDLLKAEARIVKDSVFQHGVISILFMTVATGLSSLYLRSYFRKKKDK